MTFSPLGFISNPSSAKTPLFSASLLTTLIPEIGASGYTFTRASTATMLDHEGIVQNCLSGEARFANARRVVNGLRTPNAKSSDLTDGVWAGFVGTETINSANQYTETVGGLTAGVYVAALQSSCVAGEVFTVSFSAYKVSGTSNNYTVRLRNTNNENYQSSVITLTGSLRRYSATLTVTASNILPLDLHFRAGVNESGRVIHLQDIMVEKVTQQANQNPSEYVSYGMGDDHGCGVDGVKWFSTANGNTVASNVVTEATGAALGSLGYLACQEKTNLAYPSADLTVAGWTKNNVAAAKLTTVMAGDLILNTVKASNTDSHIHSVQFSVTTVAANEDIAVSFFVKKGTLDYVFIRGSKGGETCEQFFNVNTGALATAQDSGGSVNIQANVSRVQVAKDGYRLSAIIDGHSTAGVHVIEFGVASADAATTFSAANTTDVLANFTGMQIQLDHEIGEYIPTTSGTATKAADVLSYAAANIPGGDVSMLADFYVPVPVQSIASLFAIASTTEENSPSLGLSLFGNSVRAGSIGSDGIITFRAISGQLSLDSHTVGATFTLTSGNRKAFLDGTALTIDHDIDETAAAWVRDDFLVACNVDGNGQPDYPISNIKLYPALPTTTLASLTA